VFPHFFLAQALAPIVIGLTAPYTLSTGALAALGAAVIGGSANKWWLLPATKGLKEERYRLEAEGLGESEQCKEVTKQFGKLHAVSLGFNLMNFLALTSYGFILVKGLVRYVPK
jgi:hypothetical protein